MININGEEWRIALVSPFDPILVRQDLNGFTLGTCDDLAKTIYINKDLNEDYMWKVLSHETLRGLENRAMPLVGRVWLGPAR